MDEKSENKITMAFKTISEIASIFTFAVGCAVLLGWAFDIEILKSVVPGLVTMKANTALCFLLAGISLWLLQTKRVNPTTRTLAQGCAFGVIVIAGLTIAEYFFGVNLGLDQFLFQEGANAVLTVSPGRMAINTAASFLLAGMALLLLDVKSKQGSGSAQFVALVGWVIAMLALIGYVYGVHVLYLSSSKFTAMALHTGFAFFTFFFGAFFARPDQGVAVMFVSHDIGGVIVRRSLPFTIVIPPTLGWLKIMGQNTGMIPNELGVSLVATANMIVMSSCVLWLASYANHLDRARKEKEEALRASEQQMQAINQQLRANEQQLHAANQQLRATQQQLEASNQQLRAGNQQLKAWNEQLIVSEQKLLIEIKQREKAEEDMRSHFHEFQVIFKASLGREERILELKDKVRELEERLKRG